MRECNRAGDGVVDLERVLSAVQRRRGVASSVGVARSDVSTPSAAAAPGNTNAPPGSMVTRARVPGVSRSTGGRSAPTRWPEGSSTSIATRPPPKRPSRTGAPPGGGVDAAAGRVGGPFLHVREKAQREGVDGPREQFLRRADLHQPSGAHQADAVGHREGVVGIVGDDQARGARAAQQVLRLRAHGAAQHLIEIGEGFVERQQRRPRRQSAGERDALLLAARELVRIVARAPRQADEIEHRLDAAGRRLALQAEGDVGGEIEMRKQGVILKHHADAALLGRREAALAGDDAAGDLDRAAGLALQPGGDAQQRALAATGRAEQRHGLARRDLERDARQRALRAVIVDDVAEGERAGHRAASAAPESARAGAGPEEPTRISTSTGISPAATIRQAASAPFS